MLGLFEKKIYDEFTSITAEEAPDYCKGSETQKIHSRMAEIIGNSSSVIDIGCGIGLSARHFSTEQYKGIDVSKELITEARKQNPDHKFMNVEASKFLEISKDAGLGSKKYTFGILKAVLEHQPNKETALNIYFNALKDCSTVLVAWHMIPKDKTKIHKVKGHFGKKIYQNEYSSKIFELQDYSITKERVENYELWTVEEIF